MESQSVFVDRILMPTKSILGYLFLLSSRIVIITIFEYYEESLSNLFDDSSCKLKDGLKNFELYEESIGFLTVGSSWNTCCF